MLEGGIWLVLLLALPFIVQAVPDAALCYSLQGDNYTCASCIALHPSCAWCHAHDFDKDNRITRCDTYERLVENQCPKNKIEYPESDVDIVKDEPLTEDDSNADVSVVQIRPQKVVINIRPKDTVSFQIQVGQPVNYPVDLYYLMDLSFSMADDKNKLSELGDRLAAKMEGITKNFKLGFGSFVDKKVMPFVDPRTEKMNRPCDFCIEPYGFRHHLKLTTDTKRFKHEVNASSVSGNLDSPEGGFDAIIQALSCNKEIGWREKSRKMIVFSTDAGFHYAGDGKLGGLVVPNDDQCWLDKDGYYMKSTDFDYPSIGQIHKKIRDTQANIIFAVTREQLPLYERLHKALLDVSSTVGVLAEDSSNIVNLIADEYNEITEKISLIDNVNSSIGLNVSYVTACKGNIPEYKTQCEGISVGEKVSFNVSVYLERCTVDKHLDFTIHRSGLQEGVDVQVNVLCDCECDKLERQRGPEICNGRGSLSCGVCICDDGFVGKTCECNATGVSTAQMDMQCRKNNDSEQPICSGRGYCSCGRCVCEKRSHYNETIYGPYCECDDFNCPRRDRLLCSNHGTCGCNSECKCFPGWTGPACECPDNNLGCISPNGKVCNDRGVCECGVCKCYKDYRYSGRTCEICVTCPKKCEELRQCVLCRGWGTGTLNKTMCEECPYEMYIVKDHKAEGDNETTHDCQYVDQSDGCTYYYRYLYDEFTNFTKVWIREKKDCPVPVPILPIVLGVIAGIVLIGLVLLLIWKLLTIIHDRREFAKFENERLMARWDTGENPIFHPATTTFKNPAYGVK